MNSSLLTSPRHKFSAKFLSKTVGVAAVLTGGLLLCLPAVSVLAKGEATNIYSSPGSAAAQVQYTGTADSNTYNWGRGDDGAGANGDLLIDGFSLDNGVTRYDYQSVADMVRVIRSSGGTPCGLFAETTGTAYFYKPDFPGNTDGTGCDMAAVMAGRVINVGALDVFNNIGAQAKNIERVDFIFSGGIAVAQPAGTGHVVTEKSGNNDVKIAAITALDGTGNPSAYGNLVTVHAHVGTPGIGCPNPATDICYGVPAVNRNYEFLHTGDAAVPPEKTGNSSEPLGLAFVSQADLGLSAGQTYYGFSYFATDVVAGPHTLTDPGTFPTDTDRVNRGPGDADMFGGTAGYFVLSSLLKNVSGDVVDASGSGIAAVTVQLYRDDGDTADQYDANDTLLDSIETGAPNGAYSFSRVLPGDYIVRVDSSDSDLTGSGYSTGTENLAVTVSDADISGQRFTFTLPQISGSVFTDNNPANGSKDAGEGVQSVIVRLFSDAAMTTQVGGDVQSDNSGSFTFADVPNGIYYLFVDQGSSQNLNGLVTGTDNPLMVTIQNGADVTTSYPFVSQAPATWSLSGTVFRDENADGQLAGSGEPGYGPINVTLYDSSMNQAGTTTAGSDGIYTFSNVAAGNYSVQVDAAGAPAGYAISTSDNPRSITLGANETVNFPFSADTDGDGVPNGDDIDDDNDGILDSVEQNGANDVDTDGDGVFDRLDLDSDNDGIPDAVESGATGVTIQNGRITGTVGANGLPDAVESGSETGNVNYALVDTDNDTKPDFRDLDSDNDGIADVVEAGGSDPDGNGFVGTGAPLTLAGGGVDSNGIPIAAGNAVMLTPPNTDGDTVPDYRDLDSDNDGITDVVEAGGTDGDTNGHIGTGSPPAVNDLGVPAAGLIAVPTDSDGDGRADFLELDSDNDGIRDIAEAGYTDSNSDGLVDGFSDPDGDGAGNPSGFTSLADLPDGDGDGTPDYQEKAGDPPRLETGLDGLGCTLSNNRSIDPVFPLLVLFAFLYLLGGRMQRHGGRRKVGGAEMRGIGIAAAGAVLMFTITPPASAETGFESRWYGGLGAGISELEPDPNATVYTNEETRSSGGKLFLGYDWSKRFSIEGYYSDLGEAEMGSTDPTVPGGDVGYKDYGLSALYYVFKQREAHEGFGVFGRLGFGKMENETDLPYTRLNDTHAMLGTGLEYAFRNGFALRGELDYYDTDSHLLALSLLKRFGGSEQEEPAPVPQPEPEPAPVAVVPPAPPAPEPEPAPVVKEVKLGKLGIVYFDTDSSVLKPEAIATLDEVATELQRVSAARVEVQGNTDSRASDSYNQSLSERRSQAVIDYLIGKGIERGRMKPRAFGESSPTASNDNADGRGLNRRVEFLEIAR